MILPLPKEYWDNVSQHYGIVDCVTYPKSCRHIGTDFPTPFGTPIVAPTDCTVTRVGYSTAIGYWCEVKVDDWYMIALHLRERPKTGQYAQGATIGYVGASGKINGIHSHLEAWAVPMNRGALTKSNWNLLTSDILQKFNMV